jgi:hypothetical protein
MKQNVDKGACSFLPMCDCGWRGQIATTRETAWAVAHKHALNEHPGTLSQSDWTYRLRGRG